MTPDNLPSQRTRPALSLEDAAAAALEAFGLDVREATLLGGYVDQNFRIDTHDDRTVLLKAHSFAERSGVLDLQNAVLDHLAKCDLPFATPQVQSAVDGSRVAHWRSPGGKTMRLRALSYVEGRLLAEFGALSDDALAQAGSVVGRLDAALDGFDHPAAARPDMDWDLRNAPRTGRSSRLIQDPALRRLAEYFLLQFDMQIAPALDDLPMQVTHHDCHRYSLLGAGEGADVRVVGVIDFGDTVLTHAAGHLAVTLSDLLVGQHDLIGAASALVGGYHKARPLEAREIALLYHLTGTRLAMYASMAAKAAHNDPGNPHPQAKLADVHALLRQLIAINPAAFEDALLSACAMETRGPIRAQRAGQLAAERPRHFSASIYTHYREPIILEGGALQYLYGSDGTAYLDCVNNVCQWGHCHPTIVRAAQRQMARLNTNSRYVFEPMAEFAERLTATMPDGLDTVFLVNSGSEANDLAARLARAYTGNTDFVVIDRAYHGNSALATDLSPNRIDRPGRPGLPDYVRKTECPDHYRGAFRGEAREAARRYIADLEAVVAAMASEGRPPAAFFAESLVGTGGQIVLPDGYLQGAYRAVRAAGGVCVADEVQVGFGRTGHWTWCFESQGVVPDIVTMGKPIANGHPMAAVVTRREIAEAFDNGITYFNTFGGNPVSCASALAVLDVLDQERLRDNVVKVGGALMKGLQALQERHEAIGDVRGLGLYIGIELVADRSARSPAKALAKEAVEIAKTKGVLLNTNGYDANIIKIKPPLMIDERDVDQLVSTLDAAMLAAQKRTAAL